MAVYFSPVGNGFQWLGQTGLVLAGGKINTYAAGTTTPLATYTDNTGSVPNANPIILDSTGRYAQEIWLTGGKSYKFVVTDALNVTQFSLDNINGISDPFFFGVSGIATVSSIPALRLLSKGTFSYALVTGYYANGDGGGGFYYLDTNDVSSSDNGGTIIVANDSGRWKLSLNGSPHPPLDISVQQFGAHGNGVTDDSAAINAAIAWQVAQGGGTVYFPPNPYFVSSTINVTGTGIRLLGSQSGASNIVSTTLNQTVLSVTGTRHRIEDLLIYSNQLWTSGQVVLFNACVQCHMDKCWIQGGFIPFASTGSGSSDNIVTRSIFTFGSGGANVLLQSASANNGAWHFYRCLMNQGYPVQVPVASNFKGARTSPTAYVIGDVVTSGGYYLQCKIAGTTSGGAPTVLWYGNNITDGTVTWLLMGNSGARGIQIDTGIALSTFRECDVTGAYNVAIDFTNTLSGAAPTGIHIEDCNADGPISAGIQLITGCREIHIGQATQVTNATGTGTTYGILVNAGTDGVHITDCRSYGFTNGCYVGGVNTTVANGIFVGNTTGIRVAANTNQFQLIGNIVGSVASRGANTNSIIIEAGTSNNFAVIGNNGVGASNQINDGSTGATKTISGNPGYNPRLANITTPGVPLTTVSLQNTVGCDVMVYLANGTSACTVTIGGRALITLAASDTAGFLLPAGASIILTYAAGAPAWNWLGN